jgi:GxxExxY protein
MSDDEVLKLCDVIRQTSYDIHKYLKSGHLEKVYENALAHRLRKLGIEVKQQHDLAVFVLSVFFFCAFCVPLGLSKQQSI